MTSAYRPPAPFQQVIEALLDLQHPFPPKFFHRLSDISRSDLSALKAVWLRIAVERRVRLLEDLEALMENNMLMSYDDLAVFALEDPDPRVRVLAMRLLWETSDYHLADTLIQLLNEDEDVSARAAAANILGQFVYKGEIEEIPAETLRKVVENLLLVLRGRDEESVRRRALESLGYSSHSEVPGLIMDAYESDDPDWLSSALYAMGRSADTDWEGEVMEMIDHPDSLVQLEAIRAAGGLELGSARDPLLEMIEEGIDDDDLRQAVVWSLSQIGGEGVREVLESQLQQSEDEEETDLIEEALENLIFTEGLEELDILGFEATGLDDALSELSDEENDDEEY